ncbi:MAG: porin [Desulfuromonadales bacterium]
MRTLRVLRLLLMGTVTLSLYVSAIPAFAEDSMDVHELKRVIETQQQQLDTLQKQLAEQGKLIQQLLAKEPSPVTKTGAKDAVAVSAVPQDKVVTSGEERVKLSISGHVSRAVNLVDDGKENKAYFVDNDNSESRVNFVGTAKIDDDLTLGSRIELTIAPNKASNVDQNNEEAGDVFEQRWTEVSLDSKRFGKISLGRGFTASYGTASADLSGTGVIATSTVADLSGGMLFRQRSDDSLTDIRIFNAFNDFNGLSRKNRLRYDTPKFHGAHLAVSAVSDDRYDAGLYWGGQGYGFKAAAAAGIADLNEDDTDYQYTGSFAILHEETGLNLALSTGGKKRDDQDDATNLFVKAGWLANFFSVGKTAFSIDYTIGEGLPVEDDDTESYAATVVQRFDKYGTELFAIYRLYELDRDEEPNVHDIGVASMGARVKF